MSRKPAMLTPLTDFLCVGGVSILVSLVVLLAGVRLPLQYHLLMHVTNFLINAPHFLVSYRLLYGSPQRRTGYQAVSLQLPLALAAYLLFALAVYRDYPAVLGSMIGTGTLLLAWHYTGQAYGMMAAFGFLEGLRFSDQERRLVRANLYVLLAWHVLWALVAQRNIFAPVTGGSTLLTPTAAERLYQMATVVALASSSCGAAGLLLMARRLRRAPTPRMLAPWVAIHLWYVLLYREPAALFWAQNAHALQYLIFPLRVEMNRVERAGSVAGPGGLRKHMSLFYFGTVVLGLLVMQLAPETLQLGFNRLGFALPLQLGVVAFVNIHHYFIDNYIWKLRNPAVRQDLFAHLQAPAR